MEKEYLRYILLQILIQLPPSSYFFPPLLNASEATYVSNDDVSKTNTSEATYVVVLRDSEKQRYCEPKNVSAFHILESI